MTASSRRVWRARTEYERGGQDHEGRTVAAKKIGHELAVSATWSATARAVTARTVPALKQEAPTPTKQRVRAQREAALFLPVVAPAFGLCTRR